MKAQTTQKERTMPRVAAGGGGTGVAVLVAWALGALGLDPTPEEVAALSGVLVAVIGMIVSRLGK
jgi:hypothetical protein